ncbi:hypothetical protein [Microlunatus sp. GCM10028923]|uniref:hypothetical protein n=1 Tax=Microlunatus sp. GCM10028923 TaxID=3273400 RepID=UPI003607AC64
MITSQVLTYSGDLESYIGSDGDLDEFRSPLAVLNGIDNFSLNLMHLPTPKWPEGLTRSEIEEMGRSYLQCAGSADAMTCEISKVIDGSRSCSPSATPARSRANRPFPSPLITAS